MGALHCPTCHTEVPDDELLGHEIPERYDGVCEWTHTKCGTTWDRFTGEVVKQDREAPTNA